MSLLTSIQNSEAYESGHQVGYLIGRFLPFIVIVLIIYFVYKSYKKKSKNN